MAPGKWDDEEEDSSAPSSPGAETAAPVIARRSKFDDEEDDSDVLESWDAAEDSEVEREKEKKATEAKAKAEAEAKANHKSKAQRVEEHRQAALRRRQMEDDDESDEEETEAERRVRLRQQEIDGSRAQAEELFGDLTVSNKAKSSKHITVSDESTPGAAIDFSTLPLFTPNTKGQFEKLRETLTPLIAANSKKGQYSLFLQEFVKQLAKDLPSEQIKKIASGLTTLSNEKMKEEKAQEKGGKKTKAAKTKTTLNASRDTGVRADTAAYDEDFGDDDFM